MLRVIVFFGIVLSCALFAVSGGEILSDAVPLPAAFDPLVPYIAHGWSRMALAAVLLVGTLFTLDAVLPALLDLGRGIGTTRRLAGLVERRRSGDAVDPGEFAAAFAGEDLYAAASAFSRSLARVETAPERIGGGPGLAWRATVSPHEAFAPAGERRAAALRAHVRLGLLLAASAIGPLAVAANEIWLAARATEAGDAVRPGIVCGMAIIVAAILAAGGAAMAILARLFADLEQRQVLGFSASAAELFPPDGMASAAGRGDPLSDADKAGVSAALWVLEGRLQSLPAQIADATAAGIERSIEAALGRIAAAQTPSPSLVADERLDRIIGGIDESNGLAVDIRDALHRTAAAIEAGTGNAVAAAGGAEAADAAAMLAQALAQQSVMLGTLVERIEDVTAELRSALLHRGEAAAADGAAAAARMIAADSRAAEIGESVDCLRDVVEAVTVSIVPAMERLALSHDELRSLLASNAAAGRVAGNDGGMYEMATAATAVGEGARLLHALVERQSALVRDLAAAVEIGRPAAATQADARAALAELAQAIRDLTADNTGTTAGPLPPLQQTA